MITIDPVSISALSIIIYELSKIHSKLKFEQKEINRLKEKIIYIEDNIKI
jgi:hypothetical protein